MYQIGDRVVYGMHGVCAVVDWEERTVDRKKVSYLVLEPVGQVGSRYFVPTHNAAAMAKLRNILTYQQLTDMINSAAVRQAAWIRDENQRKQTYRELVGAADPLMLMRMVRTLYVHRKQQLEAGKKVHLCDDNFLRDAEKILCSEISLVLDLSPEAAREYLRSQLTAE